MTRPIRRRRWTFVALVVLVSLVAVACRRKETIPPEVIVVVGSRQITSDDFRRYLDSNPAMELATIPPEAASALLDQFAEEVLLSEYAAGKGIDVPTERIAEAVRNDPGSTMIEKRDTLRRDRLIADLQGQLKPPTEERMRAWYDSNPDDYDIEETIHVRQILLHDRDTAESIVAQLRDGASFEDLSSRFSDAPNASRGGDIGFVGRGELPQIFEEGIFRLQPGDVSGIIETDSTFHIFKAEERFPAGRLPYERVRPLIESKLKGDALSDAVAATTSEARKAVPVMILARRLTFSYTGMFPKSPDE